RCRTLTQIEGPMHSRRRFRFLGIAIVAFAATLCAPQSPAQALPRAAQAPQAGRDGSRAPDYPVRPPAPPEQVAHGQQVFKSNCGFCHGSDARGDRKSTRLNSSHRTISYAVFCLKKKKTRFDPAFDTISHLTLASRTSR